MLQDHEKTRIVVVIYLAQFRFAGRVDSIFGHFICSGQTVCMT